MRGELGRVPSSRSGPRGYSVRAEPTRLNSAIAWLFVVGASCFALGTIPAYVDAVGGGRGRRALRNARRSAA